MMPGHRQAGRPPPAHRITSTEAAGLVVLHYDHDFDLIASVTGQPVEWIATAPVEIEMIVEVED